MANKRSLKKRRPAPKTVLRLPDLDQAKSAVLNTLSSRDAQRGYRHAMDEFIEWYCSEPWQISQRAGGRFELRHYPPHPPGTFYLIGDFERVGLPVARRDYCVTGVTPGSVGGASAGGSASRRSRSSVLMSSSVGGLMGPSCDYV